MKVLTVNCVYKAGSTGKIIDDIARCLHGRCEFIFCYEYGEKKKSNNCYRIAGKYEFLINYIFARISGLKYSTGYFSTWRLLHYIKSKTPDIVHLHCPNSNSVNIPWLLNSLKKRNIPLIVTNHAEFYYTGNCAYALNCEKFMYGCGKCDYQFDSHRKYWFDRTAYEWKCMKKAFENYAKIKLIAVSPWSLERIKISPITKNIDSKVIRNGINTNDVFYPRRNNLRKQLNIYEDKKVILHVTSGFSNEDISIKGGKYVIEIARSFPQYLVIIAGSNLSKEMKSLPINIKFLGEIKNQDKLAEYYSMADLTLVTSRRETYGMVCAESLSCGTPIVGFMAGGTESIALPQFSEFVEYGNIEALRQAITSWIDKKEQLTEQMRKKACVEYSDNIMAEKYYEVYKELLNKNG